MNWIFGDSINTDLITPGRFNITTDPQELAKVVFIEHRPEFIKNVKKGDIIIGGSNFGCGSSRETAPMAIKACGVDTIIARSFGRIFFRNCLNQGILAITANTIGFDEKDKIRIDLKKKQLINETKKITIEITVPAMMEKLHKSGGIIPYIKTHGIKTVRKLFTE